MPGFVAQTVGTPLPFWNIMILLVAMKWFISIIPAGPGSLGAFEFSGVYAFGLFAVDPSMVLTFAVFIHAMIFLPYLVIGLPVLARERRTMSVMAESVGRLISGGVMAGQPMKYKLII